MKTKFNTDLETGEARTYTCQGIGAGAKCGANAIVRTASHRWNVTDECMDEIVVYLCPQHAAELAQAMEKNRRCLTPEHGTSK